MKRRCWMTNGSINIQSYRKAGDTLQTHVYTLKVLANKRLGKLPITSSRSRRWRIFKETGCKRGRWDHVQQRASVVAAPNTSARTPQRSFHSCWLSKSVTYIPSLLLGFAQNINNHPQQLSTGSIKSWTANVPHTNNMPTEQGGWCCNTSLVSRRCPAHVSVRTPTTLRLPVLFLSHCQTGSFHIIGHSFDDSTAISTAQYPFKRRGNWSSYNSCNCHYQSESASNRNGRY
jgi:hypothetical protein